MQKQSAANYSNSQNVPPLGAGTSTSSGVTVFDPSLPNSNNTPAPPSYDQAMGNVAPTPQPARTYNPAGGWSGSAGATQTTTTTFTTYGPSVQQQQPPRNYQQPSFVQPPVVIVQQPALPLGPEPVYLTCPACHVQKLTRIEYEPSSRTHLMAALLCLVGLWCCVCLPYWWPGSCMNTHHYCGNCGKFLGTYGNAL
ncbi:hypothetical protein DOY81_009486 [Sarcophaga bullata]|nr:hypothetical protein DOY81_009486 [Sarcophaga bullata]